MAIHSHARACPGQDNVTQQNNPLFSYHFKVVLAWDWCFNDHIRYYPLITIIIRLLLPMEWRLWPAGRPEWIPRTVSLLCSAWAIPAQRALACANELSLTHICCILLPSPLWEHQKKCKERHWLHWDGVKSAGGTQLPWKDNISPKQLAAVHHASFKTCWERPISPNDTGVE